jgi:hypothetical protein
VERVRAIFEVLLSLVVGGVYFDEETHARFPFNLAAFREPNSQFFRHFGPCDRSDEETFSVFDFTSRARERKSAEQADFWSTRRVKFFHPRILFLAICGPGRKSELTDAS